jgi:serine protease SohB
VKIPKKGVKISEDLNETISLKILCTMRPTLDIEQVATGEHWYGAGAGKRAGG